MTSETKSKSKGLLRTDTSTISGRIDEGNPITAENYLAYAKAFGRTFLVALANGKYQGVEYSYSAKQWGAWLAFFKRIGLKHGFMDRREFWQVPAEWPHEFDPLSSIQGDYEAGQAFERRWLAERSQEKFDYAVSAERRVAAAANGMRTMRAKWRERTPQSHLAAPRSPPRDLGEFPERLLETELMRQA
jgi:hypothetical protein